MYSYEDRIRAVKLYIKLGKRLRATIRQLGYPTKNSLLAGTGSTSGARTCESGIRDQDRSIPISRSMRR